MRPTPTCRRRTRAISERSIIDLNTASADEIDAVAALRGHGYEIVRYREERGGFTALRQLEEVPGMAGKAAGLEGIVGFG